MVYEVIKCIKMTKDELLNKLSSTELNNIIDINHECLVLTSDFGLVKILEDGTVSSKNIIDTSNLVSNDTLNNKINNILDTKGYLTEHQSLDGYAKISDLPNMTDVITTNNILSIDLSTNITISDILTRLAQLEQPSA